MEEIYYSKSDLEEKFKQYPMTWSAFVKDTIDSIKPADVEPVIHGHYVGEYDGYADGNPVYDMWYCSECGHWFDDWDEEPTYNYCPSCGAKMISSEQNSAKL